MLRYFVTFIAEDEVGMFRDIWYSRRRVENETDLCTIESELSCKWFDNDRKVTIINLVQI